MNPQKKEAVMKTRSIIAVVKYKPTPAGDFETNFERIRFYRRYLTLDGFQAWRAYDYKGSKKRQERVSAALGDPQLVIKASVPMTIVIPKVKASGCVDEKGNQYVSIEQRDYVKRLNKALAYVEKKLVAIQDVIEEE